MSELKRNHATITELKMKLRVEAVHSYHWSLAADRIPSASSHLSSTIPLYSNKHHK